MLDAQQRGNVAGAVQHTGDVEVGGMLEIKDEIRESLYRPDSQVSGGQHVSVSRRSGAGMAGEVTKGALERGDESRGQFRILPPKIAESAVDVCVRQRTDADWLHALVDLLDLDARSVARLAAQ